MIIKELKKDFDFFKNSNLVYLDSAATSQKPKVLLESLEKYYTHYCSNIHRSSNDIANKTTQMYEDSRKNIANFINAKSNEVVFVRGTTEAINLLASSYVKGRFKTVIISKLEHHSNIVPWQLNGLKIKVVKMDKDLNIDIKDFENLLKNNPNSFVSLTHISNSFGIINPIKKLIKISHKYGAKILIDGAQAIAHVDINVKDLDADFYAFSAHKMYGPTGLGILYGKYDLLNEMKPYQGGGAMIEDVDFKKSTFLEAPLKFEAGTQAIAEVIAFSDTLNYFKELDGVFKYEKNLIKFAKKELEKIPNIIFYTKAKNVSTIISFNINGIHHSDIGTLLSKQNVMLRTGHHCTLPAMKDLSIDGTIRVSIALYNTKEDILRFIKALKVAIKMLS